MAELEFRDPLFLLAGLAAPAVWWLASRLPSSVTYSSLSLLDAAPASLRARLARLPALLLALATLALAVALAGPRTADATSRVRREGIAIAMIVDHSGSMRARDFVSGDTSIDRLEVVKRVFRDFVAGGGGSHGHDSDLIGLVAFARYADGLCPLTLDHGNLVQILDDLQIVEDEREDGTAIGEGLALAVERLRGIEAASKVAILLTDGVNNEGDIEPSQAAELAAQHGIKVYAIGAGSTGYAPVPFRAANGRIVLRRARVEIDEATLEAIAERTGGRYFHASDAEGLEAVVAEIDRLERSELVEERYLEYEEHYAPLVTSALGLMGLAALLGGSLLRRLP
ncbi:MAG: VWA domain-containing protein [Deltaproteobacteria bacterium]|nr:VWA domain-containing protein [Deltaproteobacteria bacterium]MBW2414839.1 VWA domain-containing protein [Deltaproteobacteria bacterium]